MTDKPKNSQQINSHDLGDSLSPTTADNNNQDKPQTLTELKELKEKTEQEKVKCYTIKEILIKNNLIQALSLGIQVAEEVLKNEIEWLEKKYAHNNGIHYYNVEERLKELKEQLKEEKK